MDLKGQSPQALSLVFGFLWEQKYEQTKAFLTYEADDNDSD